uniref:Olfactory receptor n=1 Tax=Gopherus evgoodei TaxID=1825980 RepID=A0A8C4YGP7_9SAUR
MSESNKTDFTNPSTFILLGIPGLEAAHIWISIPFCAMYIVAMLGNFTILFIVKREPSLHVPMFYFLCMLAVIDLVMSAFTLPKMLSIFWFNSREISFNACLTQMYFVHSLSGMESGMLVAMAFDRYMAICHPLRHSTILTNSVVAKIGLGVVLRSGILALPYPFLRLPYCRTNVISHTYCEFMALVKLACVDTTVMTAYSLLVAFFTSGLDLLLIVLSYVMILWVTFRLPSKEAQHKSLSTCSSHICVMLVFYTPAFFSFLSHRFGHVAPHVHILIANMYLLFPPMMNPIIYGVRTLGIRQRVLQILGMKAA